MTSEELLVKAEKEYKENVVFFRDKLVKKLLELDVNDIHLYSISDEWERFYESVHYLEATQMLQDEEYVKEL